MAEVMLRIAKLKPTIEVKQPIVRLKKLDTIFKGGVKIIKLVGDSK